MTDHATKTVFCRRAVRLIWILAAMAAFLMTACTFRKDDGDKVRDLEFTVMGETDIPPELQTILAEKQTQAFKMTYTDARNLYILVGYGPQQTGGYSIQVKELYLTDNAIVLDTELVGPKKGEEAAPETSYPLIIIRTELSENPVIFK